MPGRVTIEAFYGGLMRKGGAMDPKAVFIDALPFTIIAIKFKFEKFLQEDGKGKELNLGVYYFAQTYSHYEQGG